MDGCLNIITENLQAADNVVINCGAIALNTIAIFRFKKHFFMDVAKTRPCDKLGLQH